MADTPDVRRLRLNQTTVIPRAPRKGIPRRRFTGWFLKGPVPWAWLTAAGQRPGKALHMALWIRLWTGIKKTDRVQISIAKMAVMGVSRHAGYRALKALERAGLVHVVRHAGRMPWVTIIEKPGDETPSEALGMGGAEDQATEGAATTSEKGAVSDPSVAFQSRVDTRQGDLHARS